MKKIKTKNKIIRLNNPVVMNSYGNESLTLDCSKKLSEQQIISELNDNKCDCEGYRNGQSEGCDCRN